MKVNSDIISLPSGLLSALALVILPKCPFCALAYAGIFSSLGLTIDQYEMYVNPSIYLILGISGISQFISGFHRKEYLVFIVFIIGAFLLIGGRVFWDISWMMIVGAIIITTSVILNNIICRKVRLNKLNKL